MKYVVYEQFQDGKRFWRYENEDKFECEVYVDHHKCERPYTKSVFVIIAE